MSDANVQDGQHRQHIEVDNDPVDDPRAEQERRADNELADRLSVLIEEANSRVTPLCRMIRKVRGSLRRKSFLHWLIGHLWSVAH